MRLDDGRQDVDTIVTFLLHAKLDEVEMQDAGTWQATDLPDFISLPIPIEPKRVVIALSPKPKPLEIDDSARFLKSPGSLILTDYAIISKLVPFMPHRLQQPEIATRVFCTDVDGYSILHLYRLCKKYDDGHFLILIETEHKKVLGALISGYLRISRKFYGTGESFIFAVQPYVKVYKWTGKNELFVFSDETGIGVGSGKGEYGIWINRNLRSGETHRCQTYNNYPLCGNGETSFTIARLEVWAFTELIDAVTQYSLCQDER